MLPAERGAGAGSGSCGHRWRNHAGLPGLTLIAIMPSAAKYRVPLDSTPWGPKGLPTRRRCRRWSSANADTTREETLTGHHLVPCKRPVCRNAAKICKPWFPWMFLSPHVMYAASKVSLQTVIGGSWYQMAVNSCVEQQLTKDAGPILISESLGASDDDKQCHSYRTFLVETLAGACARGSRKSLTQVATFWPQASRTSDICMVRSVQL